MHTQEVGAVRRDTLGPHPFGTNSEEPRREVFVVSFEEPGGDRTHRNSLGPFYFGGDWPSYGERINLLWPALQAGGMSAVLALFPARTRPAARNAFRRFARNCDSETMAALGVPDELAALPKVPDEYLKAWKASHGPASGSRSSGETLTYPSESSTSGVSTSTARRSPTARPRAPCEPFRYQRERLRRLPGILPGSTVACSSRLPAATISTYRTGAGENGHRPSRPRAYRRGRRMRRGTPSPVSASPQASPCSSSAGSWARRRPCSTKPTDTCSRTRSIVAGWRSTRSSRR